MNFSVTKLEPLQLPLAGSHLIEASAGTGKTFTIAMLYVRLVLGHGDPSSCPIGPLTPPQILVVTFTDAATKELRDRIRARLSQAATCFRQPAGSHAPDAGQSALYALRDTYSPSEWPTCARRLELAAEWMDDAAVSTIHAWCNRMLREHAFDSNSLFSLRLDSDQSELLAEAVRDYWRTWYYPLTCHDLSRVLACWASPDVLHRAIARLLSHAEQLPATPPPGITLADWNQARSDLVVPFRVLCRQQVEELRTCLDQGRDAKAFDGRKLQKRHYDRWLDMLASWAGGDSLDLPSLDTGWSRLTPAGLAAIWRGVPPDLPLLDAIGRIQQSLATLAPPREALLLHAVRWIHAEFARSKQRQASIGFDDLLTGLDRALHGSQGTRLSEIIRTQFPVALIDEFQDTDPVQYRIFRQIYQVDQHRQDCGLILIGDPKQAIYAFRGADIHTYLQARRDVAGRLYSLDTNFRSTTGMVSAVNHIFMQAEEDQLRPGAFRFRRGTDNPVPFFPVAAQGRTGALLISGQATAGMTLALVSNPDAPDTPLTVPLTGNDFHHLLADTCASEIVRWLNRARNDTAYFIHPNGTQHPVQPGDIAVLVSNRFQADQMRQALARRGVRTVYLSERDSVFASPQASEVLRWLQACSSGDDRQLRTALSTPSLGLTMADLDALNHDEDAWEARVQQFRDYRRLWHQQGVLPMLRRLLLDFDCHHRLLADTAQHGPVSGERILTDLLHLAELLQQASFRLDGEHALLRYLAEQITDPQGDSEGQRLRLESDEHLVRIVTIHKSKGLEYPLVFLPFLCMARPLTARDAPLLWHDHHGTPHLSLQPDPTIVAHADEERLGEDLRKLYVALTRARYHTWIGLAPTPTLPSSALGYLLGLTATAGESLPSLAERANDLAAGSSAIAITLPPPPDITQLQNQEISRPLGQACRLTRTVREHWWIASYSSLLVSDGSPHGVGHDSATADQLIEGTLEQPPVNAYLINSTQAQHRFWRGAEAGTFLHGVMEWIAQNGFITISEQPELLRDQLARRCRRRGWEIWIDPLHDWLLRLITTPLPLTGAPPLALATLLSPRPEMEFWFATHNVSLPAVDATITTHILSGTPRPVLQDEQLNGMLKGFMDLVFEHDGRYYVADYKFNWLGSCDSDYAADTLAPTLLSHRYDVQASLYLFALHRLLRTRIPDYDYDRHVGGAVYLFARGITAPGSGVQHVRPDRALIDELEHLMTGHGESNR